MEQKLKLINKLIAMKRIILIVLFIGCITAFYGQENAVLDSIVNNMTKQLLVFPHEKIYLHTDKPYYITGEKIFFRAFLLDAFSNRQDVFSRYVYVELINPADSVVKRLKIRKDENSLFYGAIPLSEELAQGMYKIRAYTQYMRNQGESSFFSKQVQITDPQILSIQTQTNFRFTEAGKINTNLRFIDVKTKESIKSLPVIMQLNQNPSFTKRLDKQGWIHVNLNIPDDAATRTLYVELTKDNRIFRQYIQIPYSEGDFDVSFYPEGGHLIAGQSSNIAFKAMNTAGQSLDIKGEVLDSKGDTITRFKTFYDGMGDFFIKPLPEEHYQAVCHSGNRTLRFSLPEAQKNTFSLKATFQDNKLLVTINKQDSLSCPELYLLIHSRGSAVYAKTWDSKKNFLAFDTSIFPSGINHILLLTKDLQIVSERLVFILNNDNGIAEFQTKKEIYKKREQVQAGIQLKDKEQQPLKGNFSIAVTSDKEVMPDTTIGILSDILLRSELRGTIDNPEYYFQKGNKDAESAVDLLMRIHGWTRYAIPDVLRGEFTYPKIPFETSQEFSGTVKSGLIPKLAKNFNVALISLNWGFFDMTKTNETGRYVFRNFEFPDSTKYIIQASNKKGKGKRITELHVDEDTFPVVHTTWIEPIDSKEKSDPVFLDYVAKADQQYTLEHGMRIINLPEVQVIPFRKRNELTMFYSMPDYSLSADDIQKSGITDIRNLFYRFPGTFVSGNSIRILGALGPPLIVIDNMPLWYESKRNNDVMNILGMIDINDIAQVDVIRGISANMGMNGGNGVIAFYTKRGDGGKNYPLPTFDIKPLTPLGYQLPIEFYSPKYDTQEKIADSKPDVRTTIYWNPNVITDKEGNATLDFYSADDPGNYSVIIEGVSDDGRLIHYYGNASITVK